MLEFDSIRTFYEFLEVPPPLDEDFAIERIEQSQKLVAGVSIPAFRHCFYTIALNLTGNMSYKAGSEQRYLGQPFVSFSRPHQLTSWQLAPDTAIRGYHLVFSEQFLQRYPSLQALVSKLSFLQLGKAVPFILNPAEVILLATIYQQIMREYADNRPDRFDLIVTYVQTLLFQVRRLYEKYAADGEPVGEQAAGAADEAVVNHLKALLGRTLNHEGIPRRRTVADYADELGVSLRAFEEAIKRVTGRTAHALIQEHLLHSAQSLLLQTSLSIKEIAYQLDFNEPAHFTNFFKRYTQQSPAQFRNQHHP